MAGRLRRRVEELAPLGSLLADASLASDGAEAASKHRRHPHAHFVTTDGIVVGPSFVRTPARHDQAEDRLHRIGQESAVTAWYLLAPGTIDETMAELLQRKRSLINAVTDGQVRDEERLVEAVVRELRGRPYRHLRVVA